MTKDKDFKATVRARMAKTGERYAAARAQLAGAPASGLGRTGFAGTHAETTALVRLAAAAGIKVSEAMVLGLGGGLGGGYFVFEYKGGPPTFYVSTRCFPQYPYGPEFLRTAAGRLGLALAVKETTSKAAATKQLADAVGGGGGPVIAFLDRGALPWPGPMPGAEKLGTMPHVVVVTAVADGTATVFDTGGLPFRIPAATLAVARGRDKKQKHRLITAAGVVRVDRGAETLTAIRSCVAELGGKTKMKQMAGNFGIGGLAKWAGLIENTKDRKGWPTVFAPGEHLWSAMTWGYHWLEVGGTGGGAFRRLYAEFLDEARVITGRDALARVADQYRALGKDWTGVAHAMLPEEIPLLAETRAALDARVSALGRGDAGVAAAHAAAGRIAALGARAAAGELDAHVADRLRDLGERVKRVVAAEQVAVDALAAAVA
jgi:hypothetical protein